MFKKSNFIQISCLLICVSLSVPLWGDEDESIIETQIQEMMTLLKGDWQSFNAARMELEWSGISDARVYDIVEEMVVDEYRKVGAKKTWLAPSWQNSSTHKTNAMKNRLGDAILMLSFSGNEKYIPTFEAMLMRRKGPTVKEVLTKDPRVKERVSRYVERVLLNFEKHKNWNPKISKGFDQVTVGNIDKLRAINMLESDDWYLKRVGVKRVYDIYYREEAIADKVAESLKNHYQEGMDGYKVDALAWHCLALAKTKDEKYLPLLTKVKEHSSNRKVSKNAKKAIKEINKNRK